MPRNVRNFWIKLTVDGKQGRIETGPKARDGGFSLVVLMRDKGGISRAASIEGHALSDGRIRLEVCPCLPPSDTGEGSFTIETMR